MKTRLRIMISGSDWGLLFVLLAIAVPKCELIFKDFGMPLPLLTSRVFRAWHAGWIWLPFVLVPVEVYVFLLGRDDAGEASQLSRTLSAILLIVPLALLAVVSLALAMPFFTIMGPLSG